MVFLVEAKPNLRNEINFRNVHGIMNTSGLLQEIEVLMIRLIFQK